MYETKVVGIFGPGTLSANVNIQTPETPQIRCHFNSGTHTLTIKQRENGDIHSPMEISADTAASAGGYIQATQTTDAAGYAQYTFAVKQPGDYLIWGHVISKTVLLTISWPEPISAPWNVQKEFRGGRGKFCGFVKNPIPTAMSNKELIFTDVVNLGLWGCILFFEHLSTISHVEEGAIKGKS